MRALESPRKLHTPHAAVVFLAPSTKKVPARNVIFQKKDASKLGDLKFAKFPRILTTVAIIGVVFDLNLCVGSTSITYESYLNLVVLN